MNKELGQLFISGISGLSLDPEERAFLKSSNLGGVILFSHNFSNPAQLAELINEIQQCRNENPLFIAVDQEGGRVQRFKDGFMRIPPMSDLGLLDSPTTCYELFSKVAHELVNCGVNLNFAPVCDIHSNKKNKVIGDRSFGSDAELVAKLVSPTVRAFQKNSIIACAKHFPGHGDTIKDSHYHLPLIKKSWKEIQNFELIPFEKAVRAGVEMVMMAHLQVDSLDEKKPTTLSSKAYQMLRKELKFDGVIVSDDMEMKAISDHFSYEQAGFQAIRCGADLVEYRSMKTCQEAFEGAQRALEKKELSSDRLKESLTRIQNIKERYLSSYEPVYIPDIAKVVDQSAHQEFLSELIDKISQLKES